MATLAYYYLLADRNRRFDVLGWVRALDTVEPPRVAATGFDLGTPTACPSSRGTTPRLRVWRKGLPAAVHEVAGAVNAVLCPRGGDRDLRRWDGDEARPAGTMKPLLPDGTLGAW
jgi:hypothetical protein